MRNDLHKSVLFASLALLIACTPTQPPSPPVEATPLLTPITIHKAASGCEGEHDTIILPGVHIDAYPSLPPQAEPEHIILHLTDGTTIWEKPHYGSGDCTDYINCRRATLVLNPAWAQCSPQGIFYEVATEDGRPLWESSFWEITETTTKMSVHVGVACGHGFASPDFTAVSNQIAEGDCLSEASASNPSGMLAAAIALAATYFSYRAAYNHTVQCVSHELSGAAWSTKCY